MHSQRIKDVIKIHCSSVVRFVELLWKLAIVFCIYFYLYDVTKYSLESRIIQLLRICICVFVQLQFVKRSEYGSDDYKMFLIERFHILQKKIFDILCSGAEEGKCMSLWKIVLSHLNFLSGNFRLAETVIVLYNIFLKCNAAAVCAMAFTNVRCAIE